MVSIPIYKYFKKPPVISVTITLALLILTITVAYQRQLIFRNNQERDLENAANSAKERLQVVLRYSFSATNTLGYLASKYNVENDFEEIAHQIVADNKYIDALNLVEGGVVTRVYPLQGNESALGFNILLDTIQNKEALKAIERRSLYFAGPVHLKQGGIAIIGRLPIFKNQKFWGFSCAIVKLSTLINAAQLSSDLHSGYIFQLSKVNPNTGQIEFFLPHPKLFLQSGTVSVTVPIGDWTVYVRPSEWNVAQSPFILWLIFGLLFSFTGGILAWFIANEPYRLEKVVEEKTRSLNAEKQLSDFIINSSPGTFYMYDTQGNIVRWNKNHELITGYTEEEVLTKKPTDYIPEEEHQLIAEKMESVFRDGYAEAEAHLVTKDGKKIPYYFNGVRAELEGQTYLIGMGIDITERKKLEERRKNSEEKYRYLFNHNPALIFIWDLESLKIVEVNDTALSVYGYTRPELLAMDVKMLRPSEDWMKIQNSARDMMTAEQTVRRDVWRHLKKNGEMMYVEISWHRIEYNQRKAILSLGTDITTQYKAEQELTKSHEDIRRLNAHLHHVREEERSSIAREIHDELGQQLTGLKMDISWLSKKLQSEEEAIREKSDEMIRLIDHTIKTVRRISSSLRPGILDDLGLVAALEWQSAEFEKRSGIRCIFHPAVSELNLDKDMSTGIFRIYQETLTNVMRHAEATLVESTLAKHEDYLVLEVNDNGKGFVTQEVSGKKTLGLIGMQERARMFGGRLNIHSIPGGGTTITLQIPILSPNPTNAT